MNTLKFTPTHEWIRTDADGMTMGITDHAQQLLGDLVYVDLPKTGQSIEAGQTLGVLESVKAASDFYAPLSGTVTAVNEILVANPALINQDPYGNGWLVKLQPSQITQLDTLWNSEQYEHTLVEE